MKTAHTVRFKPVGRFEFTREIRAGGKVLRAKARQLAKAFAEQTGSTVRAYLNGKEIAKAIGVEDAPPE